MSRKTGPAIVGLDLSLTATGIAFADGSTATVKDSKITGSKRLVHLYVSIYAACLKADFVVIEDLPTHAKSAGLTGKTHGVAELALEQLSVPWIKLPPSTLKKAATGVGNCDKAVMRDQFDLMAEWREVTATELGMDDDQVDAWWLRECGKFLLSGNQGHLFEPSALEKYETEEVLALREVWS